MKQLLTLFVDILLLRRGPEEVPAVSVLMQFTVLAHLVSGTLVLSIRASMQAAMLQSLLALALLGGFTYLLLLLFRKRLRFLQTFTALCGVGVLLNLMTLPLVMVTPIVLPGEPISQMAMLANLIILGIIFWSIVVSAHVFRHALNQSFPIGVLTAVVYLSIAQSIHFMVF